jgi:hypothetical protein
LHTPHPILFQIFDVWHAKDVPRDVSKAFEEVGCTGEFVVQRDLLLTARCEEAGVGDRGGFAFVRYVGRVDRVRQSQVPEVREL